MFRPTRVLFGALRRPMNTKRGHNYYKGKLINHLFIHLFIYTVFFTGTRTGAMGRHTKKGGYIIDYNKVRTFVVPNLEGCELRPYVSHRTEKITAKISPKDFIGEESYKA
jgi:hypothetical protein